VGKWWHMLPDSVVVSLSREEHYKHVCTYTFPFIIGLCFEVKRHSIMFTQRNLEVIIGNQFFETFTWSCKVQPICHCKNILKGKKQNKSHNSTIITKSLNMCWRYFKFLLMDDKIFNMEFKTLRKTKQSRNLKFIGPSNVILFL